MSLIFPSPAARAEFVAARKFSQSTTDSLQKTMEGMKARYTASTATLGAQINHLQKALETERRQSEKLRQVLDDLTEDISREAYGRRREISLRLAFLGREESLAENLRRWIRRSKESFERLMTSQTPVSPAVRTVFDTSIKDAESLLETLNGQPAIEPGSSGSVARIVAAQSVAASLARELQIETDRRMQLERRLAQRRVSRTSTPALGQESTNNGDTDTALEKPLPTRGASLRASVVSVSKDAVPVSLSQQEGSTKTEPAASIPLQAPHIVVSKEAESPTQAPKTSSATVELPLVSVAEVRSCNEAAELDVPTPAETPSSAPPPAPAIPSFNFVANNETTSEFTPVTVSVVEARPEVWANYTSDILFQPFSATPAITNLAQIEDELKTPKSIPLPIPLSADVVFPAPNEQSPPVMDVISLPPSIPTQSHIDSSAADASLVAELTRVRGRYDALQRGFRDCHLALRELKKDLSSTGSASELAVILQKAVDRLDDFNEDARVELEIRVSDEARIASGYEALLTIPGAISDEVDETAMQAEMQAFVDGTDKAVRRAVDTFNRKLDDLQHDIASVKRALHDLAADTMDVESSESSSPPSTSPSWTSWTTNLLSPARSASPGPAPTFGTVMTSPRLRQTSFSSHPRKASDSDSPKAGNDPFASLELRIAMPAHVSAHPTTPPRAAPRPRVSSTTYMLGLGARSSFGLHSMSGGRSPPSPLAERKAIWGSVSSDDGVDEDAASDVE